MSELFFNFTGSEEREKERKKPVKVATTVCKKCPIFAYKSRRQIEGALKLSRLEIFLTLESKTLKEYFRALKLSWLGNCRALKLCSLDHLKADLKMCKMLGP